MPKVPTSAPQLNLKPNHAPVKRYYEALKNFRELGAEHEGAVRDAFQDLLKKCCSQFGWTLVPESSLRVKNSHRVVVDGELKDQYGISRGVWEAKDEQDDLKVEIKKKFEKGYPRKNIIFQAPERAILVQNGLQVRDAGLTDPEELVEVLSLFFGSLEPDIDEFEKAVKEFKERIPELAASLLEVIEKERKGNARFVAAFDSFAQLSRQSINPNLSNQAIEEMLIQHILTERIFRNIFSNSDFTRRNVIAAEIEKVIDALTSRSFNRDQFLSQFDRFYKAIEGAARAVEDFAEKQRFLNTVYEKFFQGFSVKVADTHGIVYTPDAIVNFMVHSVQEILEKEFGRTLSDRNVHILDPFVGTGNFIVHIMREIKKTALELKYKNELHCNEVMLLPYYIASMNIEHEYFERVGTYEPFEGICLVDTFGLAEPKQSGFAFMTAENTARVERQKKAPIFVVIGNPPYNMGQLNENDNNKNRKYPVVDERVAETYTKDSKASLKNKLSDPYVKAFRWASDKIGTNGIVAFVSNNSFVDNIAFDGMRKHLAQDFNRIYVLDLGGNVRKNPKLSGTTHNVFGIQVGVSINILVRNAAASGGTDISYSRVDEFWRRKQKYGYLEDARDTSGIRWKPITPDKRHSWLTEEEEATFESLLPIATKGIKQNDATGGEAIFKLYSLGVVTSRDEWVYNFRKEALEANVKQLIANYNSEVDRYAATRSPVDSFVNNDPRFLKWTDRLKASLQDRKRISFLESRVRRSAYRPFAAQFLYFDHLLNQRRYQQHHCFPIDNTEAENREIALGGIAAAAPFHCLVLDRIPDLHLTGDTQCFPFFAYNEDGSGRRENITDWALAQFRSIYKDNKISKWDIFHYVYAALHHAAYRERYAANLRRELPRIPFAPEFWPFAEAGKRLADLHVNYEKQPEYPLERAEKSGEKLDWRVQRMRLSKDKTTLFYNDFLTLKGIPATAYEYRLGNRSALEWVIDQYQVSTDKRSGITNDPNRDDDPQYIVRLVGQVITVSIETMKLVKSLPDLGLPAEKGEAAPE